MPDYTLLQAQQDVASLRGQIAHLEANAEILNLKVDTQFTAPDGSLWTTTGLSTGSKEITGEDSAPVAISGFSAGWANRGAGFPVLSCQRLAIAPSLMFVMGEVTSPTTVTNPMTVAGLGAGFQPATEQCLNVRLNSGSPTSPFPASGFLRCTISTAGSISIAGVQSTTQLGFQIFGLISLTL